MPRSVPRISPKGLIKRNSPGLTNFLVALEYHLDSS